MTDESWDAGFGKAISVYYNGHGIPGRDERGQRITDDSFVMLFNAHHEPIEFTLPTSEFGPSWIPVVDTAVGLDDPERDPIEAGATVELQARSLMALRAAQ
jgi:glycogen operon protein